ncbi:BadF/BadG/BcrA/BcrD ATPase family protein [Oricola cellulosilytica]|uniref:N-acetylglucosamine kinase n=1 Tax=Oricola cellulosilytica TaxID=1429082 RepID=A0A4R0PEX2_9HYPH|nr:BadF/BadG/BcrA/BcrD ATPase family protein [Oricola cellulosilytica]TCD15119.1 N-acetylglucosamine kinase [Oricola cellulosilytica]
MDFMLAFDGGGTNCRAALAGPDGTILGRATTGPANISTDPAGAAQNIVEAARGALADAGRADLRMENIPAFLGLAGANVSSHTEDLAAHLPFRQTRFSDDAVIALQGALGDADGVIAVLGTGSVYLGRNGDVFSRAGGWGFVVGDLGSGARLGRALLQDTLLAYDRIMPRSPLTRHVMSQFDDEPARLVAFAIDEKPVGFARFAPLVFEYAERGDMVGTALVRGAVAHVDAALAAVTWPGCETLCLLGGLAPLYAQRIDAQFRGILKTPRGDALSGAIELGLRVFSSSLKKE